MTNKTSFLATSLSGLLALVLGACTSEVADGGLPDGGAAPIAFRMPEVTKAVVENFTSEDAFSVWGGYDDNATNVFNGEAVTYDGSTWSYVGTRYWIADKTYDFYAVYPKDAGSCDERGTLTVFDFDSSEGVDLMTAEETGIRYTEGQTPKAVAFTFRHELARVNIIVQVDPGVEVTDLTATLSGYQEKGTLTRTAIGATWTLDTSSTSEQTVKGISISGSTSHDLFGDLLLIPQSIEDATLVLNLKRNGDTENYTASLDESLTAWNAGQHYRYLLHISVDAITFSNFTVDDWGETHTGGDINIGSGTGNNVNNNGN